MKMEKALKWLKNKNYNYEINKTVDGRPMIFVPCDIGFELKKWLKRYYKGEFKADTRCNYKWMCFIF